MANKPLNPILASLKENFMDKIFDYKGTMSVKDYWMFYLYASVINIVPFILPVFILLILPVWVWSTLAVLSATARRLHDAGKSPLDMLWMLLFPGGVIAVIIWCIKPTGTYNK